jgi:hypothetical protein
LRQIGEDLVEVHEEEQRGVEKVLRWRGSGVLIGVFELRWVMSRGHCRVEMDQLMRRMMLLLPDQVRRIVIG